MTAFKKHEHIVVAATGEHGVIEDVIPLAEGPWAEQFYEIGLAGNTLTTVTLGEPALIKAAEYPEWHPEEAV